MPLMRALGKHESSEELVDKAVLLFTADKEAFAPAAPPAAVETEDAD